MFCLFILNIFNILILLVHFLYSSITFDMQYYICFRCAPWGSDIDITYEGITGSVQHPSDTRHSYYNVIDDILPLFLMFFLKKILFLFIFRERGREGQQEGEKHQCMVVSPVSPTGDLAHNSGMCLDWELNWRHFGSQPMLNPLSYTSQV